MRNDAPPAAHEISFWKIADLPKENFDAAYRDHAEPYPQSELSDGSWELENPALRNLRNKIVAGKPTLKAVYGSPYRGILTGRNEAFVIDRKTRDALIAQDPKSAEILKPWLEGKDIKKWRAESRDLWVIFTRRGIDIEVYPAIKTYLETSRVQLEPKPSSWDTTSPDQAWAGRKTGSYQWYEIQDSIDYYSKFDAPKIVYGHFAVRSLFFVDKSGFYSNDKSYILANYDGFLLSLLNCSAIWFLITGESPPVRGGFYELRTPYINSLPIPPATDAQKAALASLAESAQAAAEERYRLQLEITRRIPDLATGTAAKLTERLKSWWELPDFAAFQAEVKKAFKADIPLKERNDWESWISESRTAIHALTAKITALEADINTRVNALFGLTPDEIALLESSL